MKNEQKQLPKGWEIKKLGEVLVKTEMVDPTKNPEKEFTYLDVSSVNKETKEIEGASTLLGKDAPSRARKLIRTNDVIFATVRPTHSRVALITEEYNEQVCSTGYFVLRGKENINNRYLYYFLLSDEFNQQMEKLQKGASYPAVTDSEVKSIFLRFPKSLPEQQRIVSILDEAFAAIAKAKANAEQNLKNAKELFESYLQGVFGSTSLPTSENWEMRKLNEVGLAQTGTTPKTTEKENFGDFIPFIKPADVDFSGIGDIRYGNEGLSEVGLKRGRKMESGSILMVCIGATIGKVGFAEREVSCNQQINSLTVKNEFEPKFIYYAMTSKNFQHRVLLEGKGAQATLPIINKSKWENLRISFPKSKEEQQTIVSQLDALRAETQKLEAVYRKKIADLEELKKSLLKKAFSGEL